MRTSAVRVVRIESSLRNGRVPALLLASVVMLATAALIAILAAPARASADEPGSGATGVEVGADTPAVDSLPKEPAPTDSQPSESPIPAQADPVGPLDTAKGSPAPLRSVAPKTSASRGQHTAVALHARSDHRRAVAGQVVTMTFEVSNSGTVPLSDITLAVHGFTGAGVPKVDCSALPATLLPGSSATCTLRYKVRAADVPTGRLQVSVAVVARDPDHVEIVSKRQDVAVSIAAPATTSKHGRHGATTAQAGKGHHRPAVHTARHGATTQARPTHGSGFTQRVAAPRNRAQAAQAAVSGKSLAATGDPSVPLAVMSVLLSSLGALLVVFSRGGSRARHVRGCLKEARR